MFLFTKQIRIGQNIKDSRARQQGKEFLLFCFNILSEKTCSAGRTSSRLRCRTCGPDVSPGDCRLPTLDCGLPVPDSRLAQTSDCGLQLSDCHSLTPYVSEPTDCRTGPLIPIILLFCLVTVRDVPGHVDSSSCLFLFAACLDILPLVFFMVLAGDVVFR